MHTKGPWKLYDDEILGGQFNNVVAIIRPFVDDSTGYTIDHTQANARLIKEAPALLEALEEIADNADRTDFVLDTAVQAIRKARGE